MDEKIYEAKVSFVDMDRYRPKVSLAIAKFKFLRCPICRHRGVKVYSLIKLKDIEREDKTDFLIGRISATPRHSYCATVGTGEDYYQSLDSYHSDNLFEGWAGDHIEWVVAPLKNVRKVGYFDIDEMAEYSFANVEKRGYLVPEWEELWNPDFVDDTHYSCVSKKIAEFLEGKEPAIEQGHLMIYNAEGFPKELLRYIAEIWDKREPIEQIYDHTADGTVVELATGYFYGEASVRSWIMKHPEHDEVEIPYREVVFYHEMPRDEEAD